MKNYKSNLWKKQNIVWQDGPDIAVYALRTLINHGPALIWLIGFNVILFYMIFTGKISNVNQDNLSEVLPFIIIFDTAVLAFILGQFVRSRCDCRNRKYILTDTYAVVQDGHGNYDCEYVNLLYVKDVKVKKLLIGKSRNVGTITITGRDKECITFYAVEDVDKVVRQINNTISFAEFNTR
jgi:hypothetical protein